MERIVEFVQRLGCTDASHDPPRRATWTHKPGIYEHRCPNCLLRQWLIIIDNKGTYRVVTPYPCCGVPEDIGEGE